ncbi:V-SNARE coiled-coil-like proteiny domain-containing protein [Abeliophyllum distichum]|uniref:V-SNARE coiled-coil-like proteiny domain-containing protein n=1 Tax=Abeliophyllum distichum TaxID=126358 RepID=A0ABD1QC35_9LAMI
MSQIVGYLTAYEIWDSLSKTYMANSNIRIIELEEEIQSIKKGGLPPSQRRSLFTLASYMLIFSARVGNLLDLIPFVQSSLTEETVFNVGGNLSGLNRHFRDQKISVEVWELVKLVEIKQRVEVQENLESQLQSLEQTYRWLWVLIAYQSGLIILWDVVEARVIAVQGDKVLQLKNEIDSQNNVDTSMLDETSPHHLEDKEISAICWASSNGSLFIVIMFDVTESLIRSISYQVCFAIFW